MPDAVGTHAPGTDEGAEGFRGHFGRLRGLLGHVIVNANIPKGNGCKGNVNCWRVDGTVNDGALSLMAFTRCPRFTEETRALSYGRGQRLRIGDREF